MKEIPLTQGRVALVDDADYEWLTQWKWCYHYGYASRTGWNKETKKGYTVRMHQTIMGINKGHVIDHHDGNGLNNQRGNLRWASSQQNSMNLRMTRWNKTSKYKGVSKSRNGDWQVQIRINKQPIYIGTFKNEIDAAIAYDNAAKKHFGAFANTNF